MPASPVADLSEQGAVTASQILKLVADMSVLAITPKK